MVLPSFYENYSFYKDMETNKNVSTGDNVSSPLSQDWLKGYSEEGRKLGRQKEQELYEENLRAKERIEADENILRKVQYDAYLDNSTDPLKYSTAETLVFGSEMTQVGAATAAEDSRLAWKKGHYGEALLWGGVSIASLIPGAPIVTKTLGPVAKTIMAKGRKKMKLWQEQDAILPHMTLPPTIQTALSPEEYAKQMRVIFQFLHDKKGMPGLKDHFKDASYSTDEALDYLNVGLSKGQEINKDVFDHGLAEFEKIMLKMSKEQFRPNTTISRNPDRLPDEMKSILGANYVRFLKQQSGRSPYQGGDDIFFDYSTGSTDLDYSQVDPNKISTIFASSARQVIDAIPKEGTTGADIIEGLELLNKTGELSKGELDYLKKRIVLNKTYKSLEKGEEYIIPEKPLKVSVPVGKSTTEDNLQAAYVDDLLRLTDDSEVMFHPTQYKDTQRIPTPIGDTEVDYFEFSPVLLQSEAVGSRMLEPFENVVMQGTKSGHFRESFEHYGKFPLGWGRASIQRAGPNNAHFKEGELYVLSEENQSDILEFIREKKDNPEYADMIDFYKLDADETNLPFRSPHTYADKDYRDAPGDILRNNKSPSQSLINQLLGTDDYITSQKSFSKEYLKKSYRGKLFDDATEVHRKRLHKNVENYPELFSFFPKDSLGVEKNLYLSRIINAGFQDGLTANEVRKAYSTYKLYNKDVSTDELINMYAVVLNRGGAFYTKEIMFDHSPELSAFSEVYRSIGGYGGWKSPDSFVSPITDATLPMRILKGQMDKGDQKLNSFYNGKQLENYIFKGNQMKQRDEFDVIPNEIDFKQAAFSKEMGEEFLSKVDDTMSPSEIHEVALMTEIKYLIKQMQDKDVSKKFNFATLENWLGDSTWQAQSITGRHGPAKHLTHKGTVIEKGFSPDTEYNLFSPSRAIETVMDKKNLPDLEKTFSKTVQGSRTDNSPDLLRNNEKNLDFKHRINEIQLKDLPAYNDLVKDIAAFKRDSFISLIDGRGGPNRGRDYFRQLRYADKSIFPSAGTIKQERINNIVANSLQGIENRFFLTYLKADGTPIPNAPLIKAFFGQDSFANVPVDYKALSFTRDRQDKLKSEYRTGFIIDKIFDVKDQLPFSNKPPYVGFDIPKVYMTPTVIKDPLNFGDTVPLEQVTLQGNANIQNRSGEDLFEQDNYFTSLDAIVALAKKYNIPIKKDAITSAEDFFDSNVSIYNAEYDIPIVPPKADRDLVNSIKFTHAQEDWILKTTITDDVDLDRPMIRVKDEGMPEEITELEWDAPDDLDAVDREMMQKEIEAEEVIDLSLLPDQDPYSRDPRNRLPEAFDIFQKRELADIKNIHEGLHVMPKELVWAIMDDATDQANRYIKHKEDRLLYYMSGEGQSAIFQEEMKQKSKALNALGKFLEDDFAKHGSFSHIKNAIAEQRNMLMKLDDKITEHAKVPKILKQDKDLLPMKDYKEFHKKNLQALMQVAKNRNIKHIVFPEWTQQMMAHSMNGIKAKRIYGRDVQGSAINNFAQEAGLSVNKGSVTRYSQGKTNWDNSVGHHAVKPPKPGEKNLQAKG